MCSRKQISTISAWERMPAIANTGFPDEGKAMRFRKFEFKQTLIWDGHNTIDESRPSKIIKAKSEDRARKKLPHDLGREWVLVREE